MSSLPPIIDNEDSFVVHINRVMVRLDSFSEKLDKLDQKQEKLLEETSQLSGHINLLNHRISSVESDVRTIKAVDIPKINLELSSNKLSTNHLENKILNYDSGWNKFFDVAKIIFAAAIAFVFGIFSKFFGS